MTPADLTADGGGSLLRARRHELGLSQRDLARLVVPPIAQADLSKVENGKRIGNVLAHRLLAALARAARRRAQRQ